MYKICENLFSLLFYKYLHNILTFAWQSLKYVLSIWPFAQKVCWPLSWSIHSALESKALRGSHQFECCHATQGLNLCWDSKGKMFYIQKRLRLGRRTGRRVHLGLSQDENGPNKKTWLGGKERCIKLAVEETSSAVPLVMRCDPDLTRPCVWSQFSPHWTQHCLFHCRLPLLNNRHFPNALLGDTEEGSLPCWMHSTLCPLPSPGLSSMPPPHSAAIPPLLRSPSSSPPALVAPSFWERAGPISLHHSRLPSGPLASPQVWANPACPHSPLNSALRFASKLPPCWGEEAINDLWAFPTHGASRGALSTSVGGLEVLASDAVSADFSHTGGQRYAWGKRSQARARDGEQSQRNIFPGTWQDPVRGVEFWRNGQGNYRSNRDCTRLDENMIAVVPGDACTPRLSVPCQASSSLQFTFARYVVQCCDTN